MKLSCRLEVLPGQTVLEQVNQAQRFGFDGIGLPGRMLDRFRAELDAAIADLPIPPMSLSLGFESSLVHPLPAERQRCLDSLLRLMDVCAEWEVRRLNVPPVLLQDNPIRITEAEEYASVDERLDGLLIEQLPRLGEEAQARGMVFLIEPVNRFESDYLTSIEHGARLCRAVKHPAVGMTIDAFHMQLEERVPGEAIARSAETVRHVHIAENTREEPGVGSLDLAAVFSGLHRIGYQDWIEVECRTLSGPADEVLPRSVDYVRSVWSAVGGGS